MATKQFAENLTFSCSCTSGRGSLRYDSPGYTVTWSNFQSPGADVKTITIPAILRKKSTTIVSATSKTSYVNNGGSFSETTNNLTFNDDNLKAKLIECQNNGQTTFEIGIKWKYNSSVYQSYDNYSAAQEAAAQTKTRYNNYTLKYIKVIYIDYEYTIPAIGQLDLIPSTDKVLGGETYLALTTRITPYSTIGIGELEFYIYPENKPSNGISFSNTSELIGNQEVTFNMAAQLFPVVDSESLTSLYNGKVDVKLNNVVEDTLDWSSKLQIKSGCEPLVINSAIHTWFDTNGYYEYYQSYIENASTPGVNINITSTNCSYDTFLPNNITPTLQIYFSNYDQLYTLTNGVNSFPCPPNNINSQLDGGFRTVYQCTFTLTDSYGKTASYSDSINVLKYIVPSVSGLDIQRYLWDNLSQQEITDDEGMYGRLLGQITFTKFPQRGTPPNRTPTNTVNLSVTVTSTDDTTFTTRIGALPYTAYSTYFSTLIPESNTYYTYILNGIHLNPDHLTQDEPFQSNHTYNCEIAFSDGINTIIQYTELSSATSYFLIEKEGVAVGGATSGAIGDEKFDVHYPAKFDHIEHIEQFYGQPYDTGWVNLNDATYLATSNYEAWDTGNQCPCIRRIGKIVYLRGGLKVKSGKSIAYDTYLGAFHSLPVQFQPDGKFDVPVAADNGSCWLRIGYNMNNGQLIEDPAGIVVRNRLPSTTVSADQYVSIACCYPGKD